MKGEKHTQGSLILLITLCLTVSMVAFGIGVVAAQQGEDEPNNSKGAATSIETGERVNARLGLGDEDWYSFQVGGVATLHIDLDDLGGANVELIGPSGNPLETEGPTPGDFSVDVDQSGTYYLRFTTVGSSNGDYSFTVRIEEKSNPSSSGSGSSGGTDDASDTEDKWPDNCGEAPLVDSTGTYSGVLDVPQDNDYIRIRLDRGDYVKVALWGAESRSHLSLRISSGMRPISIRNPVEPVGVDIRNNYYDIEKDATEPGSVEYLANEDEIICFRVTEFDREKASFPYEWRVSFAKNSNQVNKIAEGESEGTIKQKNEEIAQLKTEVAEKDNRIATLEQTIEAKDERISELETQINSEGSITINIEVSPAGDQNNFVSGGKALVQVSGENADMSRFQVRYQDGIYDIGQDEQVEIPLVDSGQQEMQFAYGGATESMSINVQQPSDEEASPDGSGASGPGFGIGVAVLALLCLALLSRGRA